MGRVFALGVMLLALCLLASLTPSISSGKDIDFASSTLVGTAPASGTVLSPTAGQPAGEASAAPPVMPRAGRSRQAEERARSARTRDMEAEPEVSPTAAKPSLSPAQPPAPAAPTRVADLSDRQWASVPVPRVVLSARQELSAALANAARAPSRSAVASAPAPKRVATGSPKGRHAPAVEPAAVAEMRPASKLVRVSLPKDADEGKPVIKTAVDAASEHDAERRAVKSKQEGEDGRRKRAAAKAKPSPAKSVVAEAPLQASPQPHVPRRIAQLATPPSYLGGGSKRAPAVPSQFAPATASAYGSRGSMWQRMTFEGQ